MALLFGKIAASGIAMAIMSLMALPVIEISDAVSYKAKVVTSGILAAGIVIGLAAFFGFGLAALWSL